MKAYHKPCNSSDLGKQTILYKKGKRVVELEMDTCHHCMRLVEPSEIVRPDDRRLSVIHAKINGIDRVNERRRR